MVREPRRKARKTAPLFDDPLPPFPERHQGSGHKCYDESLEILSDAIAKIRKRGNCRLGFHEALTYVFTASQQSASESDDLEAVAAVEAHARAEALHYLEIKTGRKPPPKWSPEVL